MFAVQRGMHALDVVLDVARARRLERAIPERAELPLP
eukprot:COSAG02_NODE_67195_length_253_cov_1.012987_1_plen_36_part_10